MTFGGSESVYHFSLDNESMCPVCVCKMMQIRIETGDVILCYDNEYNRRVFFVLGGFVRMRFYPGGFCPGWSMSVYVRMEPMPTYSFAIYPSFALRVRNFNAGLFAAHGGH